jgi:hypothetical protein
MTTTFNETRSLVKANKYNKFELLLRLTVVFLSASAAASVYEALFIFARNSPFVVPVLLFGILKVVVAFLCWKGRTRAFLTAIAFALISIATDITFAGNHYAAIALFIAPQILVGIFALLAYSEKRSMASLESLRPTPSN